MEYVVFFIKLNGFISGEKLFGYVFGWVFVGEFERVRGKECVFRKVGL